MLQIFHLNEIITSYGRWEGKNRLRYYKEFKISTHGPIFVLGSCMLTGDESIRCDQYKPCRYWCYNLPSCRVLGIRDVRQGVMSILWQPIPPCFGQKHHRAHVSGTSNRTRNEVDTYPDTTDKLSETGPAIHWSAVSHGSRVSWLTRRIHWLNLYPA